MRINKHPDADGTNLNVSDAEKAVLVHVLTLGVEGLDPKDPESQKMRDTALAMLQALQSFRG